MSEHEYETEQNAVAGDSLIAVLDELAQIVAGARGVPMSASAMINRSEVLDLLETVAPKHAARTQPVWSSTSTVSPV